MRTRVCLLLAAAVPLAGSLIALGAAQRPPRFNPVIELLEQKKPVFGVYAPSNRRAGGGGGAAPADAPPPKTPAQLAQDAVANTATDFIFDGSMEGNFDRGYTAFAEFVKGMAAAGAVQPSPAKRLHHPLIVKMHRIAT